MQHLHFKFQRTGETSSECEFNMDGMQGTVDIHEEAGVPESITCITIRAVGGNMDFEKIYAGLKRISEAVQHLNAPKVV